MLPTKSSLFRSKALAIFDPRLVAKSSLRMAIVAIMIFVSACNVMSSVYNSSFQLDSTTPEARKEFTARYRDTFTSTSSDTEELPAAKEEINESTAIVLAALTLTPVSNANLPPSVFESYWYAVDQRTKHLIPTIDPAIIGGSYDWTAGSRTNPAYVAIEIPPGDYVLGAGLGVYIFGIRSISQMLSDGIFKDKGPTLTTRAINPTWEPNDAKLGSIDTPYFEARAGEIIYLGDLHFVARPIGPGGGRYPKFSLSEVTQNLEGVRAFLHKNYPALEAKVTSRQLQWPD